MNKPEIKVIFNDPKIISGDQWERLTKAVEKFNDYLKDCIPGCITNPEMNNFHIDGNRNE